MRRAIQLKLLSRDHHQALVAAQRVIRLVPESSATEIATAWQQLQHSLIEQIEQHFKIEEEFLLQPLEQLGIASQLTEQIYAEHEEFARGAQLTNPNLVEIQRLAQLLKTHVRLEEQQLFPLAEQYLSAAQLHAAYTAHPNYAAE